MTDKFSEMIESFVRHVVERVDARLFGRAPNPARELTAEQMRCRHVFGRGRRRGQRCRARSMGPRYRFLCADHWRKAFND